MSIFDDDHHEMRTNRSLDDQTAEAILAGRVTADSGELEDLARLVAEVRSMAFAHAPSPTPLLAAMFGCTSSADVAGVPVMAAPDVPGPGPQVTTTPRRRKTMLETLLGSVAAKAAAALAGLTMATGAAAAADVLPQVAQDKVAGAMEVVLPLDIPDSADEAKGGGRKGTTVADDKKAERVDDGGGEAGERDNYGGTVSTDAKAGVPQQDGRSFGEKVSSNAPRAPQAGDAGRPAETPTASNNPGTAHRDSAPTSSDSPGTSLRDSAPRGQPEQTPTPESNPGTSMREAVPSGQSEDRPTAGDNPGTTFRP